MKRQSRSSSAQSPQSLTIELSIAGQTIRGCRSATVSIFSSINPRFVVEPLGRDRIYAVPCNAISIEDGSYVLDGCVVEP